MGMIDAIARFFQEGGVFMLPIALLLLFAIGIGLERFIAIRFRYYVNSGKLMSEVREALVAGNSKRATEICQEKGSAALPFILHAGIAKGISAQERELQDAVDEASLEVIPQIQKRVAYLPVIAQVATLLGLLGTIFGLIQAFAGIEVADASQRTTVLAKSISVALNTTSFGLIVAVPTLLIHGYLQALIGRILDDIDLYSIKVINLLSTRREKE